MLERNKENLPPYLKPEPFAPLENKEENKSMKKVLIYTCAVDGSGDYHAALKTLPILLEDKTLHLTWIVKSQQDKIIKEILKARQQFPTVNIIHIFPKHIGEMNSDSAQEIVNYLPTDTDLIITLPNVNEMNVLQPFFSEHCKQAKILNISEYDYTPTRQPCHTMGLGKDSLGVLIPDTESKQNSMQLQENNGLNGFNMDEPFFFGYSNNTKSSQWDQQQQLSFIRSVLMIAKKEGHNNVQIVTNIPLDIIRDSGIELESLVRQIEYHSSTGNADPIYYSSSTATTILKIFNPIPLDPDEFQILLHRSHPVALCTGDQSLIENIFALKCVFYQVMSWKRGLSKAFAEFVKEICGPNSMYYQFVYAAIFHSSSLPDFLEKEWNSSPNLKEKIQNDAKKIADAIRERKNFNNFLPSLVNLSLLPEEKLDTQDTLKDINTSSQLLIILNAFKKNNSKIHQVLQSMQLQLPGIINTFRAFKEILNMIMTDEESYSSIPVDSLSAAAKNVSQEVLSILITAMQENLSSSIKEPQQLRELFSLPLTSEQRTQILGTLHQNLTSLIPSFYELEKLFEASNGQLTSEHCRQILNALQANIGIWVKSFYDLMDLFKLFNDQLTAEHCVLILRAVQANLGTLITSCSDLKDLFKLPNEKLTTEHRTFILANLQAQLGTLITSVDHLEDLFELSSEQLTSEHRTYILTASQAQLGSLITFYYHLVRLFKLSNAQFTFEHRTLILSALKEKLGTLFTSSTRLRDLFKLSNEQLTSENRTLILGALRANFGNLFTSFYDLMDLFELSDEQLTPNHRIQILESPALKSLLISLSDDEFLELIKLVPDAAIAKISTIRRKNEDLPPQNPSKFFKSSADSEVKQEQTQKRSKQQGCQLM